MEDTDILRHLLTVEAEAASLANDAALEADKRISEAERQNRLRYEERYAKETEEREASYKAAIANIKDMYQKQLDEFGQSLDNMKADADTFSALFESLLFSGK
jgi:flavin-dependent dehydrogenase